MIFKKFLSNESGRSMVEMLGVLAIIGVLSIGAISGFSYAMTKYKANAILDKAHKLAISVTSSLMLGQQGTPQAGNAYIKNYSLDDSNNNELLGVQFSPTAQVAFGEISISVSHVPQKVCEYMKVMTADNKTSIVSVDGDCSSDDANELKLVFNDDLSPGMYLVSCNTDTNCPGCQTCDHGVCVDSQSKCDSGTCSDGICVCSDGRAACAGKCCGKNQLCWDDECKTYNFCTTNEDCTSTASQKYFCSITATWGDATTCVEFTHGNCTYYNGTTWKEMLWKNKKIYILTGSSLASSVNWYTARNICLSEGKKMASIGRLGLRRRDLTQEELDRLASFFGANVYWLEDDTEWSHSKGAYFIWGHYSNGKLVLEYGMGHHKCGGSRVLCID